MLKIAQNATLMAATLTVGLIAGVFGTYALAIMPGLRRTDDRTFVDAFQHIDRAIVNPLFLLFFVGALVLTGLAGLVRLGEDDRTSLPWIVAAFLLYLAVFVITIRINVPLNDDIKAAGNADRITDLAEVRRNFREVRWVGWNIVRTVASIVAFASLAWALVLHARAS